MRLPRRAASERFTQAAASGQPPRKSDIYAYCWTTSFPAIAETLRHGRHSRQPRFGLACQSRPDHS
jgi:hypothetical protein